MGSGTRSSLWLVTRSSSLPSSLIPPQEAAFDVSCALGFAKASAMPGPMGYTLAIVVTLGAYLAGLHWLVSPPDPWRPNARIPASTAQQFAVRKRAPLVKPTKAAGPQSTVSIGFGNEARW
jgi:hypothetical protein